MKENNPANYKGVLLYRSACSGLWYRNPNAAGDIDAMELDGERIFMGRDEFPSDWIRRQKEWLDGLNKKHSRV